MSFRNAETEAPEIVLGGFPWKQILWFVNRRCIEECGTAPAVEWWKYSWAEENMELGWCDRALIKSCTEPGHWDGLLELCHIKVKRLGFWNISWLSLWTPADPKKKQLHLAEGGSEICHQHTFSEGSTVSAPFFKGGSRWHVTSPTQSIPRIHLFHIVRSPSWGAAPPKFWLTLFYYET